MRRKTDLVAALIGLLADPESVEAALAALREGEHAVLEAIYLLAASETMDERATQRALLAWYGPLAAKETAGYLDNLAAQALLFRERDPSDGAVRYRLPQAVSRCLSSLTKPLDSYPAQKPSTPPKRSAQKPSALTLLRAVSRMWEYVAEHKVRMDTPPAGLGESAQPMLAAAQRSRERTSLEARNIDYLVVDVPASPSLEESHLRALSGITGCDPDMLGFLLCLLLDLGLITQSGQYAQVNELAMERYRRYGEMQKLQALASAWLGATSWSELGLALERSPHVHLCLPGRDSILAAEELNGDLARIRQFVARLLSLLDLDRWYTLPGFLETIRQLCPDLSCILRVPASATLRWWLAPASPACPPELWDRSNWLQSYGRLFTELIEGPLAWFGGVNLAYEGSQLAAFQLTSLGKQLLGHYSQIASSNGDMRPLTVADDLTISMQLGRVETDAHDFLSRFAELAEAEADVFRYRVTPERLNEALEDGVRLEEILSFLERVSGSAVPDPARRTLEQWCAGYGSVRLYDGLTVIEFADDYALKELLNTTSLGEHVIHQLSPRLVVIEPQSVTQLMTEMVKKGYTPKIEETLP